MEFVNKFPYIANCALLLLGLWGVLSQDNLFKKIIGINIMQSSAILFFINLAYLNNGKIPINPKSEMGYIAPLPHVLMLTAIVVGVAFTAVALSLLIKINRGYRTSRESVIIKKENPKI
ncbi:hypothetical protein CL643_00790 [bacterium]|nr:hypothetical protein [bacterium]|tara:strand:- start:773 stop:1129 length:357 start_codon:yes stop_codon:yes gene_type:complete